MKAPHTLRGRELWVALGFKNERAFQRAKSAGAVTVPLYPIPHQSRGVYALKTDVEEFLNKQGDTSDAPKEGSSMS
jgi:hypothetical protein